MSKLNNVAIVVTILKWDTYFNLKVITNTLMNEHTKVLAVPKLQHKIS